MSVLIPESIGGVRLRRLADGSYYLSRRADTTWLDANLVRVPGELRWLPHLEGRPEVTAMKDMQHPIFSIVGKGPSLRYLRAEHLGSDPVISINDASEEVDMLLTSGPHYNIRQDREALGDLSPKATTLLNHRLWYLVGPRARTYYYFPQLFNLTDSTPTIVLAIEIAKFHGARFIRLVSCDAYTNGDTGNKKGGVDPSYLRQRHLIQNALLGLAVYHVTPAPPSEASCDTLPPSPCSPPEHREDCSSRPS